MIGCHQKAWVTRGKNKDFDEFLALVIALPVVWFRCRISKALPSSNQL